MATNPSHILIARNSARNGPTPAGLISTPIETHAAASGIFRSAAAAAATIIGSPPWLLEEVEANEELMPELHLEDGAADRAIDVDPTFHENSAFPGRVKIVVESTTFWAHKEVLYFASPFFEAILSGEWAETAGRPRSVSSVITISQLPSLAGDEAQRPDDLSEVTAEMEFAPIDPDADTDDFLDVDDPPRSDTSSAGGTAANTPPSEVEKAQAIASSLSKLEGTRTPTAGDILNRSQETLLNASEGAKTPVPSNRKETQASLDVAHPSQAHSGRKRRSREPLAVIVLKEERAHIFHDFLKYVYPHLECTITWANVEGLMNISHKLCVGSLQKECLSFLLTHAAGRPIKAMRIAEIFGEEELYKEGSRFVLDNPGGWSDEEMATLSRETQLKLEKRRTWFLERVIKLGLTQIAREYQCCSTCPDSSICARQLEEKWRQAYHSVFRFGPCQPSMVYRYLRTLEGISPPLSLTHLACQTTAKAFVATLFDRMFSLGVRGSGTDTAPLGGLSSKMAAASGPRRQFLFCTLKEQRAEKKSKGVVPSSSSTA